MAPMTTITISLAAFLGLANAAEIRLYSSRSDPGNDCTGGAVVICENAVPYMCCNAGPSRVFTSVLCSGLQTVGSRGVPEYCVAFSIPPNRSSFSGCPCSCGVEGTADPSGLYCVRCSGIFQGRIRGGAIVDPLLSKRDEFGEYQCKGTAEPGVMQIDGQYFPIASKYGVPQDVIDRLWEIFDNTPDMRFDDMPDDLKSYRNMSLVAPLSTSDYERLAQISAAANNGTSDEAYFSKRADLAARAGLPSQCPAS